MSVDLPAFGNPTRPTSASSFSCSRSCFDLARRAGIRAARGPVGGRGEPGVAAAAVAAGRDAHLRAGLEKVGHLDRLAAFFGHFVDDGADRHLDDEVLAVAAVHVRAHAVLAALGLEFGMEAEADERVQVRARGRSRRTRRCRRRRRSGRPGARTSRAGRRCTRGRRRRPPRGFPLRQRTSGTTVAQDALAAVRRSLLSLDAIATSR